MDQHSDRINLNPDNQNPRTQRRFSKYLKVYSQQNLQFFGNNNSQEFRNQKVNSLKHLSHSTSAEQYSEVGQSDQKEIRNRHSQSEYNLDSVDVTPQNNNQISNFPLNLSSSQKNNKQLDQSVNASDFVNDGRSSRKMNSMNSSRQSNYDKLSRSNGKLQASYQKMMNSNRFQKRLSNIQSQVQIEIHQSSEKQINYNEERRDYRGWDFIRILAKIKKFIDTIKLYAPGQSYNNTTPRHFLLLADKSHIKKQQNSKNIVQYFSYIGSFFPVFTYDSSLLNIWKNLILLLEIIVVLIVPAQLSFEFQFHDISKYILYYFPLLCFSLDFLFQFNISYYDEGVVIINRFKIMQNYVKSTFFIDVISLIGFFIHVWDNQNYFSMLFILRIYDISKLVDQLEEFWQIEQKFAELWTLVKLFILLIILGHLYGVGFYFITNLDIYLEDDQKWTSNLEKDFDFNQNNKTDLYILSIYFGFITMTTVGYGDISPINIKEILYVIFMTLISSFVFSYTVNTIGTIFQQRAQKQSKYKNQIYHISNYMSTRNISFPVQVKVRKYLEYINSKENEKPEVGQAIINYLSNNLKDEIKIDFYGKILSEIKLFRFNFSQECRRALALHMEEKLYGPGEYVYSQGEQDNRIFFIIKGKVQMFINNTNKFQTQVFEEQNNISDKQDENLRIVDLRHSGQTFGEFGFFSQGERQYSSRCTNVSHLVYITQQNFLYTVKRFEKDYEKFCELRDQINLYENNIPQRCYGCKYKYGHTIMNCPYMHCIRDSYFIVKKMNFSIEHKHRDKEQYQRKKEKFHAYTNKFEVYKDMRKQRKELVYILNACQDSDNSFDSYISSDGSIISEKDKDFILRMPALQVESDGNYNFKESSSEITLTETSEDENSDFDEEEEQDLFGSIGRQKSIILTKQTYSQQQNSRKQSIQQGLRLKSSSSKHQNTNFNQNINETVSPTRQKYNMRKQSILSTSHKATKFGFNQSSGKKINSSGNIQIDDKTLIQQLNQDAENLKVQPICQCRKKRQFNLFINGPGQNSQAFQNSLAKQIYDNQQNEYLEDHIIQQNESPIKNFDGSDKEKDKKQLNISLKPAINQGRQQSQVLDTPIQFRSHNQDFHTPQNIQNPLRKQSVLIDIPEVQSSSKVILGSSSKAFNFKSRRFSKKRSTSNIKQQKFNMSNASSVRGQRKFTKKLTNNTLLDQNIGNDNNLLNIRSKNHSSKETMKKSYHPQYFQDPESKKIQMYIYEMTKQQDFDNYLPHNNLEIVLYKVNKTLKINHERQIKKSSNNLNKNNKRHFKSVIKQLAFNSKGGAKSPNQKLHQLRQQMSSQIDLSKLLDQNDSPNSNTQQKSIDISIRSSRQMEIIKEQLLQINPSLKNLKRSQKSPSNSKNQSLIRSESIDKLKLQHSNILKIPRQSYVSADMQLSRNSGNDIFDKNDYINEGLPGQSRKQREDTHIIQSRLETLISQDSQRDKRIQIDSDDSDNIQKSSILMNTIKIIDSNNQQVREQTFQISVSQNNSEKSSDNDNEDESESSCPSSVVSKIQSLNSLDDEDE